MMGGSNTKSTLAAYIYSSLKEGVAEMTLRTPNLDIKLALVLSAMEADYMLNKDTWVAQRKYFQLAILAYAFALGESSLTSDVLQKLEDLSQDQDDMMYWSTATQSVYKDNGRLYRSLPSGPSDIETASYVILAYTKMDNVIKGQRVLRWLMSQINGAGSFKSTQDTVIGLQAIAAISILIGKSSAGMNLTVDTDGILNKMLVVNDDNKFLYQKEKLPDDIMEVPFTVSGRGVALLTLNWKYNVMRQPLNSVPTFHIKAKTTFVNSNVFDVEIYIRLLVSSSIGQMALVTYKAPSGFVTNTDTIQGADRVENKDGKVIIYVSNMLMSRKEFRIQSTRDKDVASVKDEFVSAEMYYKPGSRSMVKYEIPEEVKLSACQLSKGENDVCPLPGNPSGAPVTTPTKLLLTLMSILMLLTNLN
ncbi:CD109 antigen-like [Ylistrum balloti]|uniref:CD109 antigen-like n=1 Tax=Ylistrum balloti TaxID=509963 RepID=UPI002905CC8D|nr:CD109 antigen-like [Ylistrum balloti]